VFEHLNNQIYKIFLTYSTITQPFLYYISLPSITLHLLNHIISIVIVDVM